VPAVAGMVLFIVLAALDRGQSPLVHRYLFGHWVNRMTTALFCVGSVSLVMTAWSVWWQGRRLGKLQLLIGPALEGGGDSPAAGSSDSRERAMRLNKQLAGLPGAMRQHWLTQRVASLLDSLVRGSSDTDRAARMKSLADDDLDRQAMRYGLPRILVWAMPLLGFLGTVLGISEAMGSLQVGGESELPQMMSGLQANLNVAFDTTAQALVLSIVMMFGVFVSERNETRLLADITACADRWLLAAFPEQAVPSPAVPELPDLSRAAWEALTRQCVTVWERAARDQFDALAREPSSARRIEAALVDLTAALGQLQRQFNQDRSGTAARPDGAEVVSLRFSGLAPPGGRDRKSA
jgi:biopolymer transport protein ExbB/TolQ